MSRGLVWGDKQFWVFECFYLSYVQSNCEFWVLLPVLIQVIVRFWVLLLVLCAKQLWVLSASTCLNPSIYLSYVQSKCEFWVFLPGAVARIGVDTCVCSTFGPILSKFRHHGCTGPHPSDSQWDVGDGGRCLLLTCLRRSYILPSGNRHQCPSWCWSGAPLMKLFVQVLPTWEVGLRKVICFFPWHCPNKKWALQNFDVRFLGHAIAPDLLQRFPGNKGAFAQFKLNWAQRFWALFWWPMV